jgi:hypothetical protein
MPSRRPSRGPQGPHSPSKATRHTIYTRFHVFSRVYLRHLRGLLGLSLYVFLHGCRVPMCNLHRFLRYFGPGSGHLWTCPDVSGLCVVYTCFSTPRAPLEPPGDPTEAQQGPRKAHIAPKSHPRGPPELPSLSPETPRGPQWPCRGPTEAQRRPTDAQPRPRRGPQWSTSCSKYAVYAVFYGVFAYVPKHTVCTFFLLCLEATRGFLSQLAAPSLSLYVFSRVF